MLFSSIEFIFIFLPLTLFAYYIFPSKAKNVILLIASLIFYGWGEPVYIILMLIAAFVGYVNGIMQLKIKNQNAKKAVFIISIILNIAILAYYKYADFLIEIINGIAGTNIAPLNLSLPIGISFYTFQIISYSIDVYRGNAEAEKNYFTLLTYVSMFPQLIAGPIVRYTTVRKELHSRKISFGLFCDGMERFLYGLFKKVIIANNIGIMWDGISTVQATSLSMASAWLGAVAFSLQLYFDFSGYADMAIGMGKMLGFTFEENFNYPYSAVSVTDFWRKWHMSLSFWFRDYVYIPLGGNRCSKVRNIFNILVVWALTGLWHGASFNFILWGVYYGILLILEKYVYGGLLEKLPKFFKHIYTLFIVVTGFTIFVFDDMSKLVPYMKTMFTGFSNIVDSSFLFTLTNNAVLVCIAAVLSFPIYPYVKNKILSINNVAVKNTIRFVSSTGIIWLFIISTAYLVSASYNPFLYFRF